MWEASLAMELHFALEVIFEGEIAMMALMENRKLKEVGRWELGADRVFAVPKWHGSIVIVRMGGAYIIIGMGGAFVYFKTMGCDIVMENAGC
jgi:hypothetical protein